MLHPLDLIFSRVGLHGTQQNERSMMIVPYWYHIHSTLLYLFCSVAIRGASIPAGRASSRGASIALLAPRTRHAGTATAASRGYAAR